MSFTSFDTNTEPLFDGSVHEYLIFGRETCPNTGRKHLQGFVWFKERRRLPFLKKWISNAHFEGAKGTAEQNQKYCSKDGDYEEFGRLPVVQRGGNAFKNVLTAAESGNIADIKENYPGLFIRYKTNILSSVKFRVEELSESCGVWICGPPRCEKDSRIVNSHHAFLQNIITLYII
ncbi:hypothetical protein AVEN_271394-1 [Araneus ventricosus]|uniref:CRESS-DNA virus Rep endonuclease domain-containing protein n=1 Tax=Araneus ventricosus TaxID=182803 RepID=A0A4Y2AZR1_ARAVE|nr:hypothetical protein AVEN_271394-1 [Araneus ventricosus]